MENNRRAEELINIIDDARDELARLIFTEQVECVAETYSLGGYFAKITVNIAGRSLQLAANAAGFMCDFSHYVKLKAGIGSQTEKDFIDILQKRVSKLRLEEMKKQVADLEKKLGAGE